MHPDYYEGILQIRNPKEEVVGFVERFSDKFSKKTKVRNGLDYYFLSQRFLRSLGRQLQGRFPGQLKSSRTLHTRSRQTGKPVYRVTVLFRCFNLKKGDIIVMKGEGMEIVSLGKKLYVRHLRTGKKQWLSFDKLPTHLRDA